MPDTVPIRIEVDRATLESALHQALDPLLAAFRDLLIAIADDVHEPTDAIMLAVDKVQLALLPFGLKDAGRPPLAGDHA